MKSVRLSSHILPIHYLIQIKPDLDNFTFEGEEIIQLLIQKPTKKIILHSRELDIESAELIHNESVNWAGKISYDKETETVRLDFSRTIHNGKANLKLAFRGILNDKMVGFYRSKYFHEGKEKHLATTQFEATYARRAFPCFDEPAMKATFEVSLVIPEGQTAISNTIETRIAEHGLGFKIVKFAPSPKMSTYLLAYIVGDFEYIQGKTKNGVAVRVFVTPGKKSQAVFALNTAIKCLEFYNNYFDIAYPLQTLDLIAIPDFAHGAMENWGAVTYRESTLLVDPEHTSKANLQWVALVIAHELAHQWFGNLVTMDWWTHLWLNEGFASFIEYLAINEIFPEWDIWTQFVFLEQGTALRLDGLKNTHPIEVNVHDPAEIAEAFDKVSYSKGAAILRMLSEYLGFEDFRKGLRIYLKRYSFSNAATNDLWKALEEASNKPVGKIMKNWTLKGGYPIINVKDEGERKFLSQERFFSSFISKRIKDSTIWNVPINVLSDGGVKKYLMESKSMTIPAEKAGKVFKINTKDAAFIRVNYQDLSPFKQLIVQGKFSAIDRLELIRDAFDLSEAGYLPTSEALDFSRCFKDETDYSVWLEIATHLSQLNSLLSGEKFAGEYQKFARGIFSKIVLKLGWTKKVDEAHTRTLLRSLAFGAFGKFGDKATIIRARRLFSGKIDPDLKGLIYDLVAENGGLKEHSMFEEKYKKELNNQERDRLGRALGAFKDRVLLKKTLKFSLSKNVRLQDVIHMLNRVWINPNGRDLAWEFVKNNWKEIQNKFAGGHSLSRLIATAGEFTSSSKAKEVEAFFKSRPVPEAKRTLLQAVERIYSNEAWLKRDRKKIEAFLNQAKTI